MDQSKKRSQMWVFILLILFINIILVSPRLLISFNEINAFDEAKYIDSGRSLTFLEVRDIAWAPIIALIYAPLELIFRSLPDRFLFEAWGGRIILYILIWISALTLASRLRKYISPLVVSGVLFTSLAIFPILENQSDALYITIAAFGLALFYSIQQDHRLRDIQVLSILLGLAVLVRFESILTMGAVILLIIVMEWIHSQKFKVVLSAIVPAIGVILLYLLLFWISIGKVEMSVGNKSWDSFEVNQVSFSNPNGLNSREETQRLYGSREANDGSIFRAISRNPAAFIERIIVNISRLPESFLQFFGKRLAPVIGLCAVFGILLLLRKREYLLLLAVILWSLPALVSLGFLARHFIPQVTLWIIILSSIGLFSIFRQNSSPKERIIFLSLNLLLVLFGWLGAKLAFLTAGFVIASATILIIMINSSRQKEFTNKATPFLILLSAGIILRGSYKFPDFPSVGKSAREQAVYYLQANLPEHSNILVKVPLIPVAAGMVDVRSLDADGEIPDANSLSTVLRNQGLDAVVVDSIFPFSSGRIRQLLEEGRGEYFQLGFRDDDGIVEIFLISD